MILLGRDNIWDKIHVIILSIIMTGCCLNHVFVYFAFLYNIVTILSFKHKYIYSQLFFLLPFSMIYKATPSSSSFFAYSMLLYAFMLLIRLKINLLPLLAFGFFSFLGSVNNPLLWVKVMSGWVILYFFIKNEDKKSTKNHVIYFAIGLLLSSIMGLYKAQTPLLSVFFLDMNEEVIGGVLTARFSALYSDPNYYSISIILVINIIITYLINNEINKHFAIFLCLSLAYFGFLSYSKMYMLTIILTTFIQCGEWFKKSKYKLLVIIAVTFILMYGFNALLSSTYFENFMSRVDTDNISTNRFFIWEKYIDYILSNTQVLILGVGLGGDLYMDVATHNTYIEALYYYGVIGCIIYIFTMLYIFKSSSIHNHHKRLQNYFPLIVLMTMISSLSCLIVNDIWFYFMLVWFCLNTDYRPRRL